MMMGRIIGVLGVLAALSACDEKPVQSEEGKTSRAGISFITEPVVQRQSNTALVGKAKGAYEKFQENTKAYGAFYTSPDGRSWGWHRNAATLADAQLTAKVVCEATAKRSCVPFATIVAGATDTSNALPASYKEGLQKALRENRIGNDFALAVSPYGSYGWAWNHQFVSEAKKSALRACNDDIAERRDGIEPAILKAYERNGILTCRIHVFY